MIQLSHNRIPFFISERTPGKNREDLWKLLKDCDMQYLNQLEWLIRTKTQYSGDKFFVQRKEDKTIAIDLISDLGNRSAVICRNILETICYGNAVISSTLTIDDNNRKQYYYDLLMALYRTERKFLDSQRSIGIAKAAKNGKYKGRERIKIDKLAAQEIFLDYSAQKITSAVAAQKLGISKSTFLRRYKEYTKVSQ